MSGIKGRSDPSFSPATRTALGQPAPRWFHCELVVDEQGERLAKRHDALSIRALREQGKRPEELLGIVYREAVDRYAPPQAG